MIGFGHLCHCCCRCFSCCQNLIILSANLLMGAGVDGVDIEWKKGPHDPLHSRLKLAEVDDLIGCYNNVETLLITSQWSRYRREKETNLQLPAKVMENLITTRGRFEEYS